MQQHDDRDAGRQLGRLVAQGQDLEGLAELGEQHVGRSGLLVLTGRHLVRDVERVDEGELRAFEARHGGDQFRQVVLEELLAHRVEVPDALHGVGLLGGEAEVARALWRTDPVEAMALGPLLILGIGLRVGDDQAELAARGRDVLAQQGLHAAGVTFAVGPQFDVGPADEELELHRLVELADESARGGGQGERAVLGEVDAAAEEGDEEIREERRGHEGEGGEQGLGAGHGGRRRGFSGGRRRGCSGRGRRRPATGNNRRPGRRRSPA